MLQDRIQLCRGVRLDCPDATLPAAQRRKVATKHYSEIVRIYVNIYVIRYMSTTENDVVTKERHFLLSSVAGQMAHLHFTSVGIMVITPGSSTLTRCPTDSKANGSMERRSPIQG